MRTLLTAVVLALAVYSSAIAESPTANYIFPAGGQRGATVAARVAGCNLHRTPRLIWSGAKVTAPTDLMPMDTLWFEGPVIPQPASQQKEDYPRDFAATLAIAADAPLGRQSWRLATSQGVTSAWGFIVGSLPEVVEHEVDGQAPAVRVELPVTINGRIFPREDVDTWSFAAKAGQSVVCHVATSEFGSPLDARIEIRGPNGQVLAEQVPEGNQTPDLQLVMPADGEYQVRIHDIAFGGLQDHVYRLTVTAGPVLRAAYPLGGQRGTQISLELQGANLPQPATTVTLPSAGSEFFVHLPDTPTAFGAARLELDDLPESLEDLSDQTKPQSVSVPAVLNGRIESPGDQDTWSFVATKGVEYEFDVRASRLGSPLDAVLELTDSTGKKLADADDSPGLSTDARLRWTAPADGEFRLIIRDRLPSRGDSRFAYRIRVTDARQADFTLSSTTDTLIVERGKTANIKLSVERSPGFKEPVELTLEGLPPGVTVASPTPAMIIAANQKDIQVTLKAEATARVTAVPIKIIGRAKLGDRDVTAEASFHPISPEPGRVAVADDTGRLWLGIAAPTPFKFVGIFETKYIPRGAVFVRRYRIDRNGFDGPLQVQLADRQGRHLQGVTAAPVTVSAGQTDFDFAVTLPPWMEIGRTCRSTLAVTGTVTDADGTSHVVSYSSNDQNNQMIALVDPGRFAVQLPRTTLQAKPGQRVDLPLRIQRGPGLTSSVSIDIVASNAIRGVTARKIEVAGDTNQSTFTLDFAETLSGIEIHPLTIRATTTDERGLPVTAETSLTLVPAR